MDARSPGGRIVDTSRRPRSRETSQHRADRSGGGGLFGSATSSPGQVRSAWRWIVLEFDGATKRFGTVAALEGCSFVVRPGWLTGFLGPNGAGKTTAMRAVFGVVELDAGRVRWRGRPSRLRSGRSSATCQKSAGSILAMAAMAGLWVVVAA
jgi:ABC-type glutathione transport system ATPase component